MKKCALTALVITVCVASFTIGWSEEPAGGSGTGSGPVTTEAAPGVARSTVEEARRQAEILHSAMHATLQVVHHEYYRNDEGLPLPAAVLKDVFAELEDEQHIKLRWLAVEGQAMNTDHLPQNRFEEEAVEALKSGKRAYEQAEAGVYRRAGAIKLTNHCLKCHVPNRQNLKDRTAGLIISIPINGK